MNPLLLSQKPKGAHEALFGPKKGPGWLRVALFEAKRGPEGPFWLKMGSGGAYLVGLVR